MCAHIRQPCCSADSGVDVIGCLEREDYFERLKNYVERPGWPTCRRTQSDEPASDVLWERQAGNAPISDAHKSNKPTVNTPSTKTTEARTSREKATVARPVISK